MIFLHLFLIKKSIAGNIVFPADLTFPIFTNLIALLTLFFCNFLSGCIKSYFLLDVEFPYLFSATKKGERNIAVRFSEKEPIENVLQFEDELDWVWIDTITKLPINKSNQNFLKRFKTCLVCPSRWDRNQEISIYKNRIKTDKLKVDMVMTEEKYIIEWKKS